MEPLYRYIVFVGEMFGAKTLHGPFDGKTQNIAFAKAKAWVDKCDMIKDQHYEIVELLPAY